MTFDQDFEQFLRCSLSTLDVLMKSIGPNHLFSDRLKNHHVHMQRCMTKQLIDHLDYDLIVFYELTGHLQRRQLYHHYNLEISIFEQTNRLAHPQVQLALLNPSINYVYRNNITYTLCR